MDSSRLGSTPSGKAAVAQVINLDSDSEEEITDTLKGPQRGSGLMLEPPKLEYLGSGDNGNHELELETEIKSDDDDDGDAWDLESVIEIEGSLEEVSDENLAGGGESTAETVMESWAYR